MASSIELNFVRREYKCTIVFVPEGEKTRIMFMSDHISHYKHTRAPFYSTRDYSKKYITVVDKVCGKRFFDRDRTSFA